MRVEGADHKDPLLQPVRFIRILSLVHEYFAALREVFPVGSKEQRSAVLSERKAPPVKIQDAVRIFILRLGVDERVVGIDIKPRFSGRKSRIFAVRPLHRRPGRVAGRHMNALEPALHRILQKEGIIRIFRGHIDVLVDGIERDIGHAQLLPLIQEGRPPLQNIAGREHRSRLFPPAQISVSAHDARVVVVLQIQRKPGLSLQAVLPAPESALELAQPEAVIDVLGHEAVREHGVKLDQHVQDSLAAADIGKSRLHGCKGRLSDLHGAVLARHLPELLQILVQVGAVLVKGQSVDRGHKGPAVRHIRVLGDEVDDVLPESVHAHIQPEAHDALDLFADFGVVHVQVRLFFGKNVKIVLFSLLVVLPGDPLKLAVPVVGRKLLLAFKAGLAPDVIVAVGVVLASLAALYEPGMLVRGVIDHQIQQHFEPQLMRAVQHFFELLQRPVFGMYVLVIGDVIAVIRVGRRVDRAEPDAVHAKLFDIFQLVVDAVQVADPVAVSVAKAPDPDLIERHLPKIILLFHFLKSSSASVHKSSTTSFQRSFWLSRERISAWVYSTISSALARISPTASLTFIRALCVSSIAFATILTILSVNCFLWEGIAPIFFLARIYW